MVRATEITAHPTPTMVLTKRPKARTKATNITF